MNDVMTVHQVESFGNFNDQSSKFLKVLSHSKNQLLILNLSYEQITLYCFSGEEVSALSSNKDPPKDSSHTS